MTITEVAKLAGVSTATVSRVINRSPRVTPDVAKSVLETIERIGYTPAARRPGPKLKGRAFIRTGNVLLLVMGMGPSAGHRVAGYPALMTGIEKAIYDHQLNPDFPDGGGHRV